MTKPQHSASSGIVVTVKTKPEKLNLKKFQLELQWMPLIAF